MVIGSCVLEADNTATTSWSRHGALGCSQKEHTLRRRQLQHLQSRDSLQKPGSAAFIAEVWIWFMHRFDTLPSHEVDAEALQGQTAG